MQQYFRSLPLFLSLVFFGHTRGQAQEQPWSVRMAHTAMTLWKDSMTAPDHPARWTYDQGVVLKGIENVWLTTGKNEYYQYVRQGMDRFLTRDGDILTYKKDDYNLDNILCGRLLVSLYRVTEHKNYYKAAGLLREQLKEQPRTREGGFWHKKRYPFQMWLDGLYMAEPFYAQYAAAFGEDSDFNDIARQFILMERHARDPKTGLLYHGWDESRQQQWADKATGHSANFWGRAMGWYGMALVDVLPYFPATHPQRAALIAILKRYAAAVGKCQDPQSGLWWDVLNKAHAAGNYQEASASCMFVYTLAKAVRLGYLPVSYRAVAQKGYDGILKKFIKVGAGGLVNLEGTVSVSGLGGNPYRDGSYEYYIKEKVVENDPKGIGAFILASNEMEWIPGLAAGKGKTVLLDNYFNDEHKKDITGRTVSTHYIWNERSNAGFSFLAQAFHIYGAQTKTLKTAPTPAALRQANIYIIVDPDDPKETPVPHYMDPASVKTLADWVKAGGVLVLMENDSGNAEFAHFNTLAEKFGIHFNEVSRNHVIGHEYEMGALEIPAGNPVFPDGRKVYIKELSTEDLSPPAKAIFSDRDGVIIAMSKLGKGTVFAVGDPWFYNEYTDGRKLPAGFENYEAAKDWVKWLIGEVRN